MSHDFLHARYDALHDTPMQRRLRALAPMPVGVVFLPWPGMTEAEARAHFRLMRELGFTCLKQTMPTPEWPEHRTLALALEEGIHPYWYDDAGGAQGDTIEPPSNASARVHTTAKQPLPGVVGDIKGHELDPALLPHFVAWLRKQYGTVEALNHAWNFDHVGILFPRGTPWRTWEEVEAQCLDVAPNEYRHLRDIMRFRADTFIEEYIRPAIEVARRRGPEVPARAGGEMGLFLPFASRGTDMQAIAEAMAEGGSFYPSIHLAWHFEEVGFEVARPLYMQAQLAADWAKGIWSATWESTGGPQYFSGGKAPFVEAARNEIAGFTVDAPCIAQLMLSYLAAGFKGFGLWCWNPRTAGWEAGEYALLDRNRQPTARARRAGSIGRAARTYRHELWSAHKEPLVGILVDWDNEAIWAAMSVSGRDLFKTLPIRARIGAARAFINANVPWEHVTLADLRAGLGPRYPVLVLPAILALRDDLRALLRDYVAQGGRLVMDMPGAYFDDYGRLLPTGLGSDFEALFGCILHDLAFARDNQRPGRCGSVSFEGFWADLEPTRARVLLRHDDGTPAFTEADYGLGTACLLNLPASLTCCTPGATEMEQLLVTQALAERTPSFACEGALVYRLAAPAADHYFLINDGPARDVSLTLRDTPDAPLQDAETGETLPAHQAIPLEAYGARWIRVAH